MARNDEVTFEIIEEIGIISEGNGGWAKELNLVSWNGAEPKYDIRDWNEGHERMTRGITLTQAAAKRLCELLKEEFD